MSKWGLVLFSLYVFDNVLFALTEFVPDVLPLLKQFRLLYPYAKCLIKIGLMLSYRMLIISLFKDTVERTEKYLIAAFSLLLFLLTAFSDSFWGDFAFMAVALASITTIVVRAFRLYEKKQEVFPPEKRRRVFWILLLWAILYLGCYVPWFLALPFGGQSDISRNISSELLGALCTALALFYLLSRPIHRGKGRLSEEAVFQLFVRHYKLTPREAEIFSMLLDGCDNAAISERSFISPNTVKVHVHNLYQKLGIQRRSQIAPCLESFKKRGDFEQS